MAQKAPAPKPSEPSSLKKNIMNILIGGSSGTVALSMLYPMESLKTIIQIQSESKGETNVSKVFSKHLKTNGFMSLYRGLPAALLRQFFFASFRLGLYFNYSDYLKNLKKKDSLTVVESTAGSLAAAAIGISSVMPFDVVFVRFQCENALPPDQRRGYTGLGNALSRIVKEEGLGTLWRGMIPAIGRAMSLNFGMLVPYDKCKAALAPKFGYTRTNYLISAAIAGFGASVCCLPFDNAKVKLQKMKPGADGKLPYKGLIDCLAKTAKNEGIFRLWAGFIPFYLVIAPHSMLSLLFSDSLRIMMGVSKK
jgi:solute carrier family 25 oxoglutarate transporter 11